MKFKWFVVAGLLAAELVLCAVILAIFWGGIVVLRSTAVEVVRGDAFSAEGDERQTVVVTGPVTLDVTSLTGNIVVAGEATSGTLVIDAHKTVWGSDSAEAEARLAELKVVVTQTGGVVKVRVEEPVGVSGLHVGPVNGRVDFMIVVPAETVVKTHSDFGDTEVRRVQGAVSVATANGDIQLQAIQAAEADVSADSNFGEVTLDSVVAREVTAHSDNGAVTLKSVEAGGLIDLSSDFGDLRFEDGQAGRLTVDTQNGQVDLIRVTVDETTAARSSYGNVTLTEVAAAVYDLQSDNGKIYLEGAAGQVTAHSSFGEVKVWRAETVTLDLSSQNGKVSFSGSLGPGPHTLSSEFGDVELTLPEETALQVDLSTEFGKIHSEFSLTLQGDMENNHWQGTINDGETDLTVKTNNGNITLRIIE